MSKMLHEYVVTDKNVESSDVLELALVQVGTVISKEGQCWVVTELEISSVFDPSERDYHLKPDRCLWELTYFLERQNG